METRRLLLLPSLLLAGVPVANCIATPETTAKGSSAQGCPEFHAGQVLDANVKVDARVRSFVQASADLGGAASALKSAVMTACGGIASDLGATDTWTALGDTDDAVKSACDAARRGIVAIMDAHRDANFALVISRGECHTDFAAEAQCEAGCSAQQKCDPGTVETRCDPAELSVVCDGNCSTQGFCEGRIDAEANCEGTCEAECTGHCSGSCTDESGHKTDNDPNCHGKCKDHCSGKCNGRCMVDVAAGIQCGSSVSCKGGCMSTFTEPKCETECTPPKCMIDESCFESCRANAAAKPLCAPPTVKLLADASVSADVAKLIATINKNLPALVHSAEAQGHIMVDEVQNLGASGKLVLEASGNLDLKSVACATAAAETLAQTTATVQVSAQAGAAVTTDCSSRAD